MERKTNQVPEQELAEKVIQLHDSGLGFRRVARELTAQGYKMNKDKAAKIFGRHKTTVGTDVREDEELRQLRRAETKARQQLEIRKEKEELRKRLTILFVEQETSAFERRRRLFTDEKRLLRFAQKVMPVVDPMLWCEFKEFCQEKDLDLAAALSMALEDQMEDFEELAAQDTEVKKRLDTYLCEEIREFINLWDEDDGEEWEQQEKPEHTTTAAKKEEHVG